MKKLLSIILILALSVFIFSCEVGPEGAPGATGTSPSGGLIMNFQYEVYPSNSYDSGIDSTLYEYAPIFNDGLNTLGWIGKDGGAERFIIKFIVSGYLPSNAVVTSAELTVHVLSIEGLTTVKTYSLSESWFETSVTWNERFTSTAWSWLGGIYNTTSISNGIEIDVANEFFTWGLSTSVVQNWLDNPSANYGIVLKAEDEIGATNIDCSIATSDNTTLAYRPKLTIHYVLQ